MDDDKYTVQDLVKYGYEQQPVEFDRAFKDIIADRVAAAIDNKKIEMAQTIFSGDDKAEDQDWEDDDQQDSNSFDQGTEDGETA